MPRGVDERNSRVCIFQKENPRSNRPRAQMRPVRLAQLGVGPGLAQVLQLQKACQQFS